MDELRPSIHFERLAAVWARKHIADPAYDADPRWELVWSITARAIHDSLERERRILTERRPASNDGTSIMSTLADVLMVAIEQAVAAGVRKGLNENGAM